MKKIATICLTLALVFTFGGVAGALVYHITDAAEALRTEVDEEVSEYKDNKDFMIKNDTTDFTQQEIERMRIEVNEYLNEKISQDYTGDLNKKTNEIKTATDQKIEELKQYIDSLFGEGALQANEL